MLTGQIWHSFDFPAHVFFASHYQRAWWSLWEPRWFAGFDVASYPPLPHQLAALLGWLIGNGNAVNSLTFLSIVVLPIAVNHLTRTYFGLTTAGRAATIAVVTPSILLAGYAFGQLPTLFALDAGLFTAVALGAYLRLGGFRRLILLLTLAAVTVAAHHATFIFFFPPLLGTVLLAEILSESRPPGVLLRAGASALGLVATALLTILPFWVWHATEYVLQAPIDHQSRHDFLVDPIAQDLFFWAEHGILVVALLLALPLLVRRFRQIAPWYLLATFLLVVSLGGTTALPRILFGEQWEWLTYDRFAIWADVPLVMLLAASAPGIGKRFLGRIAWHVTLGVLAVYAAVGALMPALVQSEPTPIDPAPIVAFLQRADHQRWRYLTLGMGDQAGLLNALTDAGTLDGQYYTARRLPILTSSGIAQIDFSLLWDPTARTLRQLLADPRPYGLRWAFTRDPSYEALLRQADWNQLTTLSNGVRVWQASVAVPAVEPSPRRSGWLAVWWGVVPLAALVGVGPAWWWARSEDDR